MLLFCLTQHIELRTARRHEIHSTINFLVGSFLWKDVCNRDRALLCVFIIVIMAFSSEFSLLPDVDRASIQRSVKTMLIEITLEVRVIICFGILAF